MWLMGWFQVKQKIMSIFSLCGTTSLKEHKPNFPESCRFSSFFGGGNIPEFLHKASHQQFDSKEKKENLGKYDVFGVTLISIWTDCLSSFSFDLGNGYYFLYCNNFTMLYERNVWN